MSYLKVKDGAKILHNLYRDYLNRLAFKEIYIPLELTKKQKEKFNDYVIPKEEKWVYANGIIDIPIADLRKEREKFFPKEEFLKAVVDPLRKVFSPQGKIFTINAFALNYLFFDDFDKMMHWLCKEGNITCEEAEMVVSKVIAFLEK